MWQIESEIGRVWEGEREESQEGVLNQIWQKDVGFSCGAQVDRWSPHTLSDTQLDNNPTPIPPAHAVSMFCFPFLFFHPSLHPSILLSSHFTTLSTHTHIRYENCAQSPAVTFKTQAAINNEARAEVPKSAVPQMAGKKKKGGKSFPKGSHSEMLDFTAEVNMFTA